MQTDIKKLPQSQVSISITVEAEEYQKYLDAAARHIQEHIEIKGFRKGHASLPDVIKQVGMMPIYEQAIQRIIPAFFLQASKENNLETVGSPDVKVEKLAPGNPIVFTVTTALLPTVTLPDFEKIKVEKKTIEVAAEKVDAVLVDIQKGRAKEAVVDEVADKTHKVVVDMHMKKDGVPVEGGDAHDYGIYLDEDHYVPGMTAQLIGVKKGDTKEFHLKFPDDHYQKHLAGKEVDFNVTVKDVFKRELSPLDDEFAKSLGQESMEKLRELIRSNLYEETAQKEKQRYEVALLDELISKTKFSELPEVIVKAEKEKMIFELKRSLERAGIPLETYLADLKKTEEDLRAEWTSEAEKRAKAALFSRQFAKEQHIEVTPEEIEKEKNLIRENYKNEPPEGFEERLQDPGVTQSIATIVQNRKVMEEVKKRVSA